MPTAEFNRKRILAGAALSPAIAGVFFDEIDSDGPRVALPRAEVQIVVRFGIAARDGLDVHALGAQQRVRRKRLRAGQRAVTARLNPGAVKTVLGVSPAALAGHTVALDELWEPARVASLLEKLHSARDPSSAAALLAGAISMHVADADDGNPQRSLALSAAVKLSSARVKAVAEEVGVSPRHLRRVFREYLGVAPKEFARVARFRHALDLAREASAPNWAAIAAIAGYYDQAHLIEEFHAIAGVTPRALLSELSGAG